MAGTCVPAPTTFPSVSPPWGWLGAAPAADGHAQFSTSLVARSQQREDAARQRLRTDPHSPEEYRVNGVVRNMDEWYEAFGVTPDDELYLPPEERVRIW